MEKEVLGKMLCLKEPFTIAGASTVEKPMIFLRLHYNGGTSGQHTGFGEGSLSIKSQETIEDNIGFIENIPDDLLQDPVRIKEIIDGLDQIAPGYKPAKCAVDLALYDLNGKLLDRPVYNLFDLSKYGIPSSFMTIGLGSEQFVLDKAAQYKGCPEIKVKVDKKFDLGLLEEIKSISGADLAIDANESWSTDEAIEKINDLAERVPLEFVEQPIARSSVSELKRLRQRTKTAIFLDESIVTKRDIEECYRYIDGINIKLMKCGGMYRAIEMISHARERNLSIMIGSMIESSIGITAASHIAHLADYLDIDGSSFLSYDPFVGTFLHKGRVILPTGPGLGVIEKTNVQ